MPSNIEAVLALALGKIADQEKPTVQRTNPSPMYHRGCKSCVSVVASDEKVEGFSRDPLFSLRPGEAFPGKQACGFRLTRPVHPKRIVHRGAAEQIALRTHIFECSRIDKQPVPFRIQADA